MLFTRWFHTPYLVPTQKPAREELATLAWSQTLEGLNVGWAKVSSVQYVSSYPKLNSSQVYHSCFHPIREVGCTQQGGQAMPPCTARFTAGAEPPGLGGSFWNREAMHSCPPSWDRTITTVLFASAILKTKSVGLRCGLCWRGWDVLPRLVTHFSMVPKHWCRRYVWILGQHLQHDLAH